jgi:hypothetical protein
MANVSYIKNANDTWSFKVKQARKYLYSKSGFKTKEEAEKEGNKAIEGIDSIGYGRGFYLMSPGMTVAQLCHIWIDENPAISKSRKIKDDLGLKIADEYFSDNDVLEMTFDDFKNKMIHLQFDLGFKLYILQHLTYIIKNALFFIGVENFTEKKG